MFIPYKVKNPPKHFPIATVTLIGLNIFVFAFTVDTSLSVRPNIVDEFAVVWGVTPLVTIITSVFLHADLFHILGNMLFLWVFGQAVEDRMGIPQFLGLYFLSGIAGHIAQDALGSACSLGIDVPNLGASGCIMGILGAYWYLYSWSPVCIFYWISWIFTGTFEVAAIWVIGAYFLMDLANGFLAREMGVAGGVANFAHVGGAFIGALLVAGLGFKRDTGKVSEAKAAQADLGDAGFLDIWHLKDLVDASPDDEDILIKYAMKAVADDDANSLQYAIDKNKSVLITNVPDVVARLFVMDEKKAGEWSSGDLLILARSCESKKAWQEALNVYRVLEKYNPQSPDIEMTLYRSAAILWHQNKDSHSALSKLGQLLRDCPTGHLVFQAEDLRDEIAIASRKANAA